MTVIHGDAFSSMFVNFADYMRPSEETTSQFDLVIDKVTRFVNEFFAKDFPKEEDEEVNTGVLFPDIPYRLMSEDGKFETEEI